MNAAPPPRPFAELPRAFAPLGYRNYLLYWVGFLCSNMGRTIEVTGTVWLMYELTGSPVLLGLLGVARAIPAIALSPIAGVVADRVDQRKALFITQGLGLIASACLGALVASGLVQFWHVYVQVVLQSAFTAFDAATRNATYPRLVPRARIGEAVTLTSVAGRSSQLIGPAIGGLAIANLGVAAPFFINAVTFLALMSAVVLMRGVVPRVVRPGSTFYRELTEGLGYMLREPVLSALLKMEVVFGLFQVNAVLITIVGRETLGVGPEGLGVLLSAPALGGVAGIAIVLALGHLRRQGRFSIIATLLYALSLAGFALSRSMPLTIVMLALAGALDAVMATTRLNITQLAVPGRMRGRVMGNMGTITRGLGPLAQTQTGIVSGLLGGPLAALCAAGVLAVSAAANARWNRRLWDFSREVAVAAIDPADLARTSDLPL